LSQDILVEMKSTYGRLTTEVGAGSTEGFMGLGFGRTAPKKNFF
jgi:hypothetical protein